MTGGRGTSSKYDVNKMKKVFSANELQDYNGSKKFSEYIFDADNNSDYGTKAKFEKGFSFAYQGITTNDLAIFVYSGHGMEDSAGNGLGLAFGNGKYYKYEILAKKLSTVKCKRMIVIINACGAGAFYKLGYKSLSVSLRKKITVFLSSASDQASYRNTLTSKGAYFIDYIAAGLGYKGVVYADSNADDQVTIEELATYVNLRTAAQGLDGIPDMDPTFYSDHKKDILYSASGIKASLFNQTIYVGQKLKISPSVSGIKDKTGTWKSSNTSVVSVNSHGAYGTLLGKKAGTATITYKINTTIATCKVTVRKCKLTLNHLKATLVSGKTLKLKAKTEEPSSKVTWSTSDKKIATVKNGKVTAKKAGTCIIVAKANGKTVKCKITVKKAVTKSKNDITAFMKEFPKVSWWSNGWKYSFGISDNYVTIGDTYGKIVGKYKIDYVKKTTYGYFVSISDYKNYRWYRSEPNVLKSYASADGNAGYDLSATFYAFGC